MTPTAGTRMAFAARKPTTWTATTPCRSRMRPGPPPLPALGRPARTRRGLTRPELTRPGRTRSEPIRPELTRPGITPPEPTPPQCLRPTPWRPPRAGSRNHPAVMTSGLPRHPEQDATASRPSDPEDPADPADPADPEAPAARAGRDGPPDRAGCEGRATGACPRPRSRA